VIDELEQPPNWRRGDKVQNKIAARSGPKRIATASEDQRINDEDVAQPERKKEVCSPHAVQSPIQGPTYQYQEQAEAAM
jgi:hypothetical protein